MLAFIDQVVIPFLASLYGGVGYLGVLVAMVVVVDGAMIVRMVAPMAVVVPTGVFGARASGGRWGSERRFANGNP